MAGVGKGLLKREIDFEHETIGEIGKGTRDGLGGGRHLIPIFGLLFSASLLEQASLYHWNRDDKILHIFYTNINSSIEISLV